MQIDLTTRSNAIAILLGLSAAFGVLTFIAYLLPHSHPDLERFCVTGFGTFSSGLLLALKMSGPENAKALGAGPETAKGAPIHETTP